MILRRQRDAPIDDSRKIVGVAKQQEDE